MLKRSVSALAAIAAIASSSAFAVELSYRWKVGDVHRFTYVDDTTVEMKVSAPGMGAMGGMPGMDMMGMAGPGMQADAGGMKTRAKVTTTFSQKVLAVRPDGTADIELVLERMEMSAGGAKSAVLSQIPAAARVVKAEVDKKGHAKFFNMVTVYVQDGTMYVGVKASGGRSKDGTISASGTASAGGQEVTLVASVNPKTGKITASASTKAAEPPPPALKKVQVKEDAQQVDVIPQQIFEMMVLPDGDLPEGGRAVVKTMFGDISSTVESLKPNAKIRIEMGGKKVEMGAKTARAAMPKQDEDEENSDENKASMASADMASASTKMDVDARYEFDVGQGRLVAINGTTASDMGVGGMTSVKTASAFSLKRVP